MMLAELRRVIQQDLPGLLEDPRTPWQTLDVLYEEPRVKRVWMQLGANRLYLHEIHPCTKPFFHPHKWPCAVRILSKAYLMNLGYGPPDGPAPPIVATMDLKAGSEYEMLDPNGWHDVSPYEGPSLSVMLSGPVWDPRPSDHAKKSANKPLEDAEKAALLGDVSDALDLGSYQAWRSRRARAIAALDAKEKT